MGKKVNLYPSLARSVQIVTLDNTQYRLTFTWYERLKAWYMNVHTLEGVAIAIGRRVSPGYGPLMGLLPENKPTGIIFVRGKDGYSRDDLGVNVFVIHYSDEEIPEATEDDSVRVVVSP